MVFHGPEFNLGQVRQADHLEAGEAARVDAGEGLQIHVHVQGQAVIGAAVPHPQPERGALAPVHIDTGGIRPRIRGNAVAGSGIANGHFQSGNQVAHPEFPPPLGGAASAARYIRRVRDEAAAAGESVLLVDVGDMFQGTPIGNKTEGRAVIDYFNAIGYDFAVPGNHDFDFGREVAEARARQSNFPWVAANLIEQETGQVTVKKLVMAASSAASPACEASIVLSRRWRPPL